MTDRMKRGVGIRRLTALLLAALLSVSGCSHPPVSGTGTADASRAESSLSGKDGPADGFGPAGEGERATDKTPEASSRAARESGYAGEDGEFDPDKTGPEEGEWIAGTPKPPLFSQTGEEPGTGEQAWEPPEGTQIRQRIVLATDLHYLAKRLSGNRCGTFMSMTQSSDGRVLQYSWEILDAFIDDMLRLKPDIIVLSGDLTMYGERESHEELADKLQILLENDIPVIVIPGNHDINNHDARQYTSDGTVRAASVTAEEFALIYSDYGYVAADSQDPNSLSYLYCLDDYYWLMMLDSCQYEPSNLVGGMIRSETYDWMEEQLSQAWEQGAQVITVSHHNLLDQSGVSREFYDDCTIEHNEQLVELLSDEEVLLHLSGHLHLQHYMEDEDSGLREIVTGSLVMAPCGYGDIKILDDGAIHYDAVPVDVEGWAARNSYRNRDLAHFNEYSEDFLRKVAYQNAILDLRKHTLDRKLFFDDATMEEMARFYAELCVYYYGGRMYQIADRVEEEKAYEDWSEIGYVSDLSDFLQNILEDEAKDYSHLEIPY